MKLQTQIGPILSYTPYYIYQMMVAGGCTLLKLCKSFFAAHIDMEYAKSLFNRTIWAIRGVSVISNDLPERLAEVLAQMWKLGTTPSPKPPTDGSEMDDSLMLKVRCRMSMSLLFDSVWRWREDTRTKGRNIEGKFDQLRTIRYAINMFASLSQEPNEPRFQRRVLGFVFRSTTARVPRNWCWRP